MQSGVAKDKFSKKQWQLKQQRRCKQCIADNREVTLDAPNDDPPPSSANADDEGASSWTDEDLFKEPQREECPICCLPLPLVNEEISYQPCCGKIVCGGCIYADTMRDDRRLCPFCRTPGHNSSKEYRERINKRAEANDPHAIYTLGLYYDGRMNYGSMGLPQNPKKANKLWLRAGKLGCVDAYRNIGSLLIDGRGVERDEKKAKYYWELSAMGGDVVARYNLGCLEGNAGNMNRAVKHSMIAAAAGYDASLANIRHAFLCGDATKDDFEKALRAHKEATDEMKSEQREAAAAYFDQNK